MKNIRKIAIAIAIALIAPSLSYAQSNSQIDVSANVDPWCFLSADNINFGVLNTPITNQSAQGNMKVHCSKNAILNIDIQYSGVSTGAYTGLFQTSRAVDFAWGTYTQDVKIFLNNKPISNETYDFHCSVYRPGQISISSEEAKIMYGSNTLLWQNDPKNLCDPAGVMNMTTLNNWEGGFDYGMLSGAANGEEIRYNLEMPNDSSKVWSKGLNTYNIVATGVEENILMKANIKSLNNPNYRMTPDSYSDTLSVIITY